MPSFKSSRRVPHSASDMFELVADVEKYPQFVPLCERLRVKSRDTKEDGREVLLADMTVAYKIFRETFTSRVTLDRPAGRILVEYVSGPFHHMENRWTFRDLEHGRCEIGFSIDYELRSRTLAMMMGAVFDRAFRKFADAFEARAAEVYGGA